MIRGIFRLLMQLVALVVLAFVLTSIYVVYDGLNDQGDTADCAVVLGHALRTDGQPGPILQARLDRAVLLYRDKKVPLLIVSGGQEPGGVDEAAGMASYLEVQGVPARAILEDHHGAHTAETARDVAAFMRARNLHSVIVVSHYYHITRTKLALRHEGIPTVGQAHVGTVVRDDIFNLARETAALWYYLFQDYLQPAAARASVEAKADAQVLKEKISSEANKAKSSVEKAADDK